MNETIQSLRREIELLKDQGLKLRHIKNPCKKCMGHGIICYGSTAMWNRGAVGGNAITPGRCDSCWGSGDEDNPWENLLELTIQKRTIDTIYNSLKLDGWIEVTSDTVFFKGSNRVVTKSGNILYGYRSYYNDKQLICYIEEPNTSINLKITSCVFIQKC